MCPVAILIQEVWAEPFRYFDEGQKYAMPRQPFSSFNKMGAVRIDTEWRGSTRLSEQARIRLYPT